MSHENETSNKLMNALEAMLATGSLEDRGLTVDSATARETINASGRIARQ